jgi:hypothetical protein
MHPLPTGAYICIWQAIAWQATLNLGAIDSHPEALPLIPVPEIGPDPQGMSHMLHLCHHKKVLS